MRGGEGVYRKREKEKEKERGSISKLSMFTTVPMGGGGPLWRDITQTMVVGEATGEGGEEEGVGEGGMEVRPGGGEAVGAEDPI